MNELHFYDRQNIWHPFTPLTSDSEQVIITSAQGSYLISDSGRRIFDAISSWWVNLHGHCHPNIVEAVSTQAGKLEQVIFAGFTHEPAIQLSRKLLSVLPQTHKRIFFSDDGSTSVEVALKMAIQYWHMQGESRDTVVAIDGGYHGDTFGAMSVGGRSIFTAPFENHLFETIHIDFPNEKNESRVLQQFEEVLSNRKVAAFIYEPLIQGAAGMRMYSPQILEQLLQIARKYDVLCIADEVMTGFYRTGRFFASDYLTPKPDLMCLSKGLTGGTLPLGVTSCSDKIISVFESSELTKTFFHGHSFTANPIACAAANASFELLASDTTIDRIRQIETEHKNFVPRISLHPRVAQASSLGTIFSLELKTSQKTGYENDIRKEIYRYFLQRDILLRPLGNVIYIIPPYSTTSHELRQIYDHIEQFLNTLH